MQNNSHCAQGGSPFCASPACCSEPSFIVGNELLKARSRDNTLVLCAAIRVVSRVNRASLGPLEEANSNSQRALSEIESRGRCSAVRSFHEGLPQQPGDAQHHSFSRQCDCGGQRCVPEGAGIYP